MLVFLKVNLSQISHLSWSLKTLKKGNLNETINRITAITH